MPFPSTSLSFALTGWGGEVTSHHTERSNFFLFFVLIVHSLLGHRLPGSASPRSPRGPSLSPKTAQLSTWAPTHPVATIQNHSRNMFNYREVISICEGFIRAEESGERVWSRPCLVATFLLGFLDPTRPKQRPVLGAEALGAPESH